MSALSLALVSYSLPAIVRLGALRICSVAPLRLPPASLRAGTIVGKQTRKKAASENDSDDDAQRRLLASLNAGMNSWSNFDDAKTASKPPTKNAGKQQTKRKGRDGKLYLRDGPKRPPTAGNAKLTRRMSTDAAPPPSPSSTNSDRKVRIEESKSGGKRLTIVRGLPSEAAKAILKELKTALSVGGRVNARGEIEMQGAHAELVLIRLQAAGYGDVRLAGGAGAKSKRAPMWNAPKEVRDRAEAQKVSARKAKQKQAERERAAARSPEAVASKMLAQLKASEALEVAKLRRSDVPKAEKRIAQEKLERIQRRIEEVG